MLNEKRDLCGELELMLFLLEPYNVRSFHRSGDLLNPLLRFPLVQNNERRDFPVLATDKHPGKQRKSRADCRAGLLLWSGVEDNVLWHAVLIWTALTQDALSHTQGKCKSVLITWVSQTERERNAKLSQQTSTPSDLHYRPAAGSLSLVNMVQHRPALNVLLLQSDMFGGSSALIWQHSFSHPLSCVLHCVPSVFRPPRFHLDLSGKRREVPLGTFLSHLGCLKNCCTWLAS